MSRRNVSIAALLAAFAAVAFFVTRPAPPAAPPSARAQTERETPLETPPEPPRAEPFVAPAPVSHAVSPLAEPADEEEVVRQAPGAPDRADGLDLPPPAIPTEPVPRDPAVDEYRERAEHVPAETQLAYVRNSLHLLDGTIDSLETELAAVGASTADGRRLTTRIARMRQARDARAAELATLAEQAGVPPTEEPIDDAPRPSVAP